MNGKRRSIKSSGVLTFRGPLVLIPADCSVLRTPTILPDSRISWDYYPTFMLLIWPGHKIFRPDRSKLLWAKDLVTPVSYVIGNTICISKTHLIYHIMRKIA